eukprot:2271723-Prymnesium_polylepis.1
MPRNKAGGGRSGQKQVKRQVKHKAAKAAAAAADTTTTTSYYDLAGRCRDEGRRAGGADCSRCSRRGWSS